MIHRQILDGVALLLDRFLSGEKAASAPILRDASDPSRTLLAAGVVVAGLAEIWYELEAQQEIGDDDLVRLVFRAAGGTSLSPALKAVISFGPIRHPMRLDSQGKAALSVPVQSIQDRWTRRTLTPVVLMLNDE